MKKNLQSLIATGRTKQAISQLLKLSKALEDLELIQEIILTSSRHAEYEKKIREGTLSEEEQKTSINQIKKSTLKIIEQLPNSSPNQSKKKKLIKITLTLIIGAIILAFNLFVIFHINDKEIIKNENHPPPPKEDSITGDTNIHIPKLDTINSSDKNPKTTDTPNEIVKTPMPKQKDTKDTLPIKKQFSYKIKGTVSDNISKNRIENVEIVINKKTYTSDKNGSFDIDFSMEKEELFTFIQVQKENYKICTRNVSFDLNKEQEVAIGLIPE